MTESGKVVAESGEAAAESGKVPAESVRVVAEGQGAVMAVLVTKSWGGIRIPEGESLAAFKLA